MSTQQGKFNDFFTGFPEPEEETSDLNYEGVRLQKSYRVSQPVLDIVDRIEEAYGHAYGEIQWYGEEEDEPREIRTYEDDVYLRAGTANLGDEAVIEVSQRPLTNGGYRLHCTVEAPSVDGATGVIDNVIKPAAAEYRAEKQVGPVESMKESPDLGWDDIVLPGDVQYTIEQDVLKPFFYPQLRDAVGLDSVKGVMLEGEPGVGKTLLAKVIAGEYDANFYDVKASDLLSKWYGESNENVRKMFDQVREDEGYSIVFLDEADTLLGNRDGIHEASQRVVNEFLGQMDGFEDVGDTLFIGATNRYDSLDPAAVRSGRFTECITIPAPDEDARREILAVHTRQGTFENIDYDELARRTDGYVGADLKGLTDHARKSALQHIDADNLEEEDLEFVSETVSVTMDDFEYAFEKMDRNARDGPTHMYQ